MTQPPRKLTVARSLLVSLIATSLVLCSCGKTPSEPRRVDAAGLEAFCDEFFSGGMEELRIPGLTFVAVQDGETVLTKGYGLASIEDGRAVEPETAVFRIGSISKIIVAVAVMQLVERGQLDLQADVNSYLHAFQVENPFRQPLTLEHLLTHTGGIQDPPYESQTDPSARLPLEQGLAQGLGAVLTAPGKRFLYSSYGYGLAAYMVEEVSGLPFDEYTRQHIFQPLGMDNTDYLLSPPSPEGMTMGYASVDAAFVAQPLDWDDDYPGGSIVSTAPDMAVLLTVLLGDGCSGDACVLEAATLADMQSARVRISSGSMHQGLGLVRGQVEGQTVLGHSGAIRGFAAILDMFPDHNAGYFFAFNAECLYSTACAIISEFREAFAERFLS
jgi:CubicO group peptidase (beta-lactamase class C family)